MTITNTSHMTVRPKWPASGDLFLLAAVFAWGMNFPIAKSVLSVMDPLVFSSTRYLAASFFLFFLLIIRRKSIRITGKDALQLFGIGLLGVTLFQGGWAFGLNLTTASKASILLTTAPVFGSIFAMFKGERTSIIGWIGILLSLFGVFIIINNNLTEITLGDSSFVGDMLMIGAACVWALYTTVSGTMIAKHGPILVTAWGMLFGATLLTLAGIPALMTQDWAAVSPVNWLAWSSTALIGAACAFIWYSAGISRLGITRGMSYSFVVPVVAIATAVLFLGENMSSIQIGGAIIVLIGIKLTRSN